jgi:hypothetical protein
LMNVETSLNCTFKFFVLNILQTWNSNENWIFSWKRKISKPTEMFFFTFFRREIKFDNFLSKNLLICVWLEWIVIFSNNAFICYLLSISVRLIVQKVLKTIKSLKIGFHNGIATLLGWWISLVVNILEG